METENTEIKIGKKLRAVCPKHGDIENYAYRVNMPEFGFNNVTYCLVCAVEYLQMIAQECEIETIDEETKE